jgi:hypothetical protein
MTASVAILMVTAAVAVAVALDLIVPLTVAVTAQGHC